MSTITVVGTLLLLIIAAAAWAIMPRQVGKIYEHALIGDTEEYWPPEEEVWEDEYEGWK